MKDLNLRLNFKWLTLFSIIAGLIASTIIFFNNDLLYDAFFFEAQLKSTVSLVIIIALIHSINYGLFLFLTIVYTYKKFKHTYRIFALSLWYYILVYLVSSAIVSLFTWSLSFTRPGIFSLILSFIIPLGYKQYKKRKIKDFNKYDKYTKKHKDENIRKIWIALSIIYLLLSIGLRYQKQNLRESFEPVVFDDELYHETELTFLESFNENTDKNDLEMGKYVCENNWETGFDEALECYEYIYPYYYKYNKSWVEELCKDRSNFRANGHNQNLIECLEFVAKHIAEKNKQQGLEYCENGIYSGEVCVCKLRVAEKLIEENRFSLQDFDQILVDTIKTAVSDKRCFYEYVKPVSKIEEPKQRERIIQLIFKACLEYPGIIECAVKFNEEYNLSDGEKSTLCNRYFEGNESIQGCLDTLTSI